MNARSTCSYTPMRTCYINRIHGGVYFLLTFTNYVYAKENYLEIYQIITYMELYPILYPTIE